MPLFSVDYTYTHLASCREIGDCDIKVVQKQLVDPVDIIFLVCLQLDSLHRNLANGNCPCLGEAGNSNEYDVCKTDSPNF